MTHKGWRVVKPQLNQSIMNQWFDSYQVFVDIESEHNKKQRVWVTVT